MTIKTIPFVFETRNLLIYLFIFSFFKIEIDFAIINEKDFKKED